MGTITVGVKGHGWYSTTGYGLDVAIERHLPNSAGELRKTISGLTGTDWDSGLSVSECLIVLADIGGY